MECTVYTFNGIEIILIKVNFPLSLDRPTAIRLEISHTIDTPSCELYHTIVKHILSIEPTCKVIIYSQKIHYLHSFDRGLKIELTMSVGTSYRQNELEHSIDVMFWKELRPLLVGRMENEHIDIYLSSLRESLIKKDKIADEIIFKHGLSNATDLRANEILTTIKHKIINLTELQINRISKVILNNELTYATSSNVFNLHKAEPQQQNSLNVKHTSITGDNNSSGSSSSSGGDDDVNKNYKYIDSIYDETIQSGMTYISMPDNLVFINIRMNYCKFMEFVARNYFVCFRITSNVLAFVSATVGLTHELFNDFRQVNINHKLIQFDIIEAPAAATDHTKIKFSETPRLEVWQSGDAKLLKIMSFSEETLNSNVKTFDIYAIVCIDFMDAFLRQTCGSVNIRRVVVFEDFKFYYALFTVNIQHVSILSTLIVSHQERTCHANARAPTNLIDVLWGQRNCCSLIYHTYFKWINDALYVKKNEQHMEMLTQAAALNLINYKFIKETQNLDPIPRTADEAETFVQVLIETRRNIYRDLVNPSNPGTSKSKKVKFSSFDGIKDGPMVAAVSVRTCEKLTNSQVLDKEWPVNVTNVTMLLNTPDYRGVQNPVNSLTF